MDTEGAGGERETPARRRGQGELEAQVLSVLGEATEPVTAAWVLQRLGGGLSYSTVITILTRLHAKQAVTRTGRGRPVLWQPVANEAGLAALRMRRLLDKQSDRDAVLSSFVSVLSADDEELLRSLLAESEPGGGTESDPGSGPESDPGNGLGGPGGPGGPRNGLGGPAGPGAAPTDRPEG
ncbi:BlaI/MecI/CopY family transcriptional regulator [Streptomyces cyaneofuscatus]|uniref:BlaI/MecI/CopY family transcriptional regulator n=1 Tax=Streptomyces cyaneofuscatus TaxID=66883 RepID=UPI00379ABB7C